MYPTAKFLLRIFWACRFEWSQVYSADAFLPAISGFQEPGPAIVGCWSQGTAAHSPLGNFLPLAHLTPRTFLCEITRELWCIYYVIKFFSHLKEITGVGSNIHCPDLQNIFFDWSVHFCGAISRRHFPSLLAWPILCVHMALLHCRKAVSSSLFVLLSSGALLLCTLRDLMDTSVCVSLEYGVLKQENLALRCRCHSKWVEIKGFHIVRRCCQIRRCRKRGMFSRDLSRGCFFLRTCPFVFWKVSEHSNSTNFS